MQGLLEIAFAQSYFAIQTRRAELIEQRLLEAERISAMCRKNGVYRHAATVSRSFELTLIELDANIMKYNKPT